MSLISLPYIFQPGTTIASAQVNADFASIVGVVNGNLDGTNFSTVFTNLNLSSKGHGTIAGGLIFQWASPTGVPFDNASANNPSFDIPFPNSVFGVWAQCVEDTIGGQAAALSPLVAMVTTTGFQLTVVGGKAGSTGTVYWLAVGF